MSLHQLLAVVVFFQAGLAWAQCSKDTDCKGERVCVAGQCADPQYPEAPPPPPPPPPPTELRPGYEQPSATDFSSQPMLSRPSHWARGAGIMGIITASAVAGFGILSAVFNGDTGPAIGFGAFAWISAAVGAPIVAVGASSARFDSSIPGAPGLRITGWVGYGLAMAVGAVMIVVGLVATFPTLMIVAVAALGAASILCLSLDAFTSASQADARVATRPREELRVFPKLLLARRADGGLDPVFGFGGTF